MKYILFEEVESLKLKVGLLRNKPHSTFNFQLSTLFFLLLFSSPLRAQDEGFRLQLCGDIYSWTVLAAQNKLDYKCYQYIPADIASKIAGNKVTDIIFSTTTDFTTGAARTGEVFVAETMEGGPISSTPCTFVDCYAQYQQRKDPFQTVTLNDPYIIKEGQGFYIGYIMRSCRYSASVGADYPIGVDNKAPSPYSGDIEVINSTTGETLGTVNMGTDMGQNLFIAAKTIGAHTGFEDILSISGLSYGSFSLPVLSPGDKTPLKLAIENLGSNDIKSFDYNIAINGIAGESVHRAINLPAGTQAEIDIPAPAYSAGKNAMTMNVTKVNSSSAQLSTTAACFIMNPGEGFKRKLVVEEGTGTWCGYCPRGIVGMEYMEQKYPDDFIGIAIHKDDNMSTASYNPLLTLFPGYPNCIANRDQIYLFDPNKEYLEFAMDLWKDQLSPAAVSLSVTPQKGYLAVSASTTFAVSEKNADYRLAFVILEDGITDIQHNYFSGNPGELEWWGEQPEEVQWTYRGTARDIFDCYGLPGSVPTDITAGAPMTFSAKLSTQRVSDVTKSSVVALLLDSFTGVILNAAKVEAKDYLDPAAITAPASDTASPAEYYTPQGIRLPGSAPGGITLLRQNGKVKKIRM